VDQELEDLLEFLYVCPVGIVEFDNAGHVSRINPKAANLLASRLGFIDIEELFPILDAAAPDLVLLINASKPRAGTVLDGRVLRGPSSLRGNRALSLSVVRVNANRLMAVLTDVSPVITFTALAEHLAPLDSTIDIAKATAGACADLLGSERAEVCFDSFDAPSLEALASKVMVAERSRLEIQRRFPPDDDSGVEMGINALIALPLVSDGEVLGVLRLDYEIDPVIDASYLARVETVGDVVTTALRRAQAFEYEAEHRRRSEALAALASSLAGSELTPDTEVSTHGVAIAAVVGLRTVERAHAVTIVWTNIEPGSNRAVTTRASKYGDADVQFHTLDVVEITARSAVAEAAGVGPLGDVAFETTSRLGATVPISGLRLQGFVRFEWSLPELLTSQRCDELRLAVSLVGQALNRSLMHENLEIEHERLAFTLEGTNTGWFAYDPDADSVSSSPSTAALFGLVGDAPPKFADYLPLVVEHHRDRLIEAVERAIVTGEGYDIELQLFGSLEWLSVQTSVVQSASGKPFLLGLIRNISHRKAALAEIESSAVRLRRILDGLFVMAAVVIPDGTIIEANRPALDAAGLDRNSALGSALWDLPLWVPSAAMRAEVKDHVIAVAAGQVRRFDTVFMLNGSPTAVDVQIVPVCDEDSEVSYLVVSALDVSDRVRREQHEHELLERQISITNRLQRSLLPTELPALANADIAARYHAADNEMEVGGDWYDAFVLANGRLALAIGDIVGRGVEAAGATGQIRSACRALANVSDGPSDLVSRLDQFVANVPEALYATFLYLELDVATGICVLTRAGHVPPLIIGPDGTGRVHEAGGTMPLGVDATAKRVETTFVLEPGALLLLCTDGLVERRGECVDIGFARLLSAAVRHRASSVDEFLDRVIASVMFEHPALDDTCAVAIRRHPAASIG
jgi:PAS domain S-box-containing protein